MFYSHWLRVKQLVYMLYLVWNGLLSLYDFISCYDKQIRLTYSPDVNNSVISIFLKKIKFCEESFSAKVDKSYQGQQLGFGSGARAGWGSWKGCRLLEGLEHEELLEDLGLTGLPNLPRQEHLIHHRVHL